MFEVLVQMREVAEPEDLWQETKEILLNAVETCIPKKWRQKNDWTPDETVRTVSQKKREIGRYIHELCIKLEEEQSRSNSKGLFQMV